MSQTATRPSFISVFSLGAVLLSTASSALAQAAGADRPARPTLDQVLFDFQVEVPARPLKSNPSPVYPEALRALGVEGQVITKFVVDTTGLADTTTFQVLKATNRQFVQAVHDILPSLRFSPALVGTRPVKMLLQMPFTFSLSPKPAAPEMAYRPTLLREFIPPQPVPASVKGFELEATFKIDTQGTITEVSFLPTLDDEYNAKLDAALKRLPFRAATTIDGTPIAGPYVLKRVLR